MKAAPILRMLATALGFRRKDERALFDARFYRAANSDVAAAGIDPFNHYMRHGWQEGRDPSPSFSTLFYRDRHLDGDAINPLTHYIDAGGPSSGLETKAPTPAAFLALQRTLVAEPFDAPYYIGQSGRHDQEAVLHYLTEGWRSGYSPHADFDPNRYLQEHAFVRALDVSPFYHFVSQRRLREARQTVKRNAGDHVSKKEVTAAIASAFDAGYYLAHHADLRAHRIDPIEHFVEHGWREHRNPTALFDMAYYRARNRDVADSGANPFYHYLTVGRAEGRRPNPAGSRLHPKLVAPQPQEWASCPSAADTANADYVVVMPVYKGFDETLAAIHAVLAAPQRVRFALHVINDKTPDAELGAALESLAARGLFSFDSNPANIGFVKSCNRGLRAFADREVVLLNADAIVFGDWLDRIDTHARRDPQIATITPLSNNATICSYPVVNADNLIELECPADLLDQMARTYNAGRVSDLPTGVGFCFYMSRASRDAIGLFDEDAFGRGYGEENDFCLRAAKAGYRNVLAEDILVYHAGQVSFGNPSAIEDAPGQSALIAKHPDYRGRVKRHLQADPGIFGRMRLDLGRLARFARGGMVFVSHALQGGVVTHIRHMERRLCQEGIRVIHLRVGVRDRWSVEIASEDDDAPFCPNLQPISFHQIRPLLAEFLTWLDPLAIHVHSLVGFDWGATTGLLDMIDETGLPYYFTLHDYSVMCHRNDLVLTNGRYCGLPEVDVCRTCVAGDRSYPEALDPAVRRQTFDAFLRGAARVFAPSQDIADRLRRAGATFAIEVRPHEELSLPPSRATRCQAADGGPVRLAIIGAIGQHKGSHVLLDLARDAAARGLPIIYSIVGWSDCADEMAAAGVSETGRYVDETEAVDHLEHLNPNGIFLPSIWPETYCYTLSLAMRLGFPPVVFDLGAQRDRVRAMNFGFVLPLAMIDDVRGLSQALLGLPYRKAQRPEPGPTRRYGHILREYYGLREAASAGMAGPPNPLFKPADGA